jgi:DNA-binding XRE family transcriptional regulator
MVEVMQQKSKWKCRLAEMRAESGLSLRDLEAATGVTNATLCYAEKGADVNLSTAVKIARFFCVPVETIWPEMLEDS